LVLLVCTCCSAGESGRRRHKEEGRGSGEAVVTSGEKRERNYVVGRRGERRRNRTRTGFGVRRRKRIKTTTEPSLREEENNSDGKMNSGVVLMRNNSWLKTEKHEESVAHMLSDDKNHVKSGNVALTLENFDKETIKDLLEKKEKRVGEVVLVEGKPAIIRKRKTLKKKYIKEGRMLRVHHPRKVKVLKESKNRTGGQLNKRRVRVKVRARHGISLEDIEDQLQKTPDAAKKQKIRLKRPNRPKLQRKRIQKFSVFKPL